MKIIRPLKYAITAAAVCILCFAGNGEYLYTVFALSPENDIIDLPDSFEDVSGRYNGKNPESKKEKLLRSSLYRKYISQKSIFLSDSNVMYCGSGCIHDIPIGFSRRCYIDENTAVYGLLLHSLPGNRSP
ncbi:MAG: hypothetical protein NC320_13440 [Clostridium sp.]|nr:hypothetical protein [Clostridium sp.]MCM1547999.1 hypothetical protein [Ruminococcus sp.]